MLSKQTKVRLALSTFVISFIAVSGTHCSGKLKVDSKDGFKVETTTTGQEDPKETKQDLATLLQEAVDGSHRSDRAKARDPYRHPIETLEFMGLQPEMTVMELSPGGEGWYVDILAPVLAKQGKLIVTSNDPNGPAANPLTQEAKQLKTRLQANPEIFSQVEILIPSKDDFNLGAAESVDLVLTFRNSHIWQQLRIEDRVYKAVFQVLKPGGVFGIEQHRADPNQKSTKFTGYLHEDYLIKKIEAAGFVLVEKSEINANPKDTKNYRKGVWTLPPVFALGAKDRDKYAAIGESDRMTLKFRKPLERSSPTNKTSAESASPSKALSSTEVAVDDTSSPSAGHPLDDDDD